MFISFSAGFRGRCGDTMKPTVDSNHPLWDFFLIVETVVINKDLRITTVIRPKVVPHGPIGIGK